MTAETVRVSERWLSLREPADAAARARQLVEALRGQPAPERWVIHDLGCGSGAMGRWLAPLLPGQQHWILHDRDPGLLEAARANLPGPAADGTGVTVETRRSDINRLQPGELAGATLITASALLDMLTGDELARLAGLCVAAGCPALLTLSVVGRVELVPGDPLDGNVGAAFNAHQRRMTDTGRLLGPDAPAAAAEEFGRLGAQILRASSPWRLEASHADLALEWFAGWVAAACAQAPELAQRTDGYRRGRLAQAAAGQLRATVDHEDLLIVPAPAAVTSPSRYRDLERVRPSGRLRGQVATVGVREMNPRGYSGAHVDAKAAELPSLVRVVAEQGDLSDSEGLQHLRGDEITALVLPVAQGDVRLIGVEPGVLERVGLKFGVQPDAPPLLAQVQQVAPGVGDPLHRLAQLRPAVASLAAKHVSGQALAVRPDQRWPSRPAGRERGGPIAQPEGDVLLAVDQAVEAEHSSRGGVSVAEAQRDRHLGPDRCVG